MPPDPSPRAGRRAVLGGLVGGSVAALAGCGIRLEDDAPRVSLLPARTPVPEEAGLVDLTRACDRLAALTAAAPGDLPAALAALHERQHTVLRTHLLGAGVPAEGLDAAPATPAATPSGSVSPGTAEREVAEAEARGVGAADVYSRVGSALLAPVAALHAQRYAAVTLLTGEPPTVPVVTVSGASADDAAAAVDAATYLLQVVAARTTGPRRERAADTLESLGALRAEVAAGGEVPPPAVGHPLPFPVESSADARRLALSALTALRTTLAAGTGALVEDAGGVGMVAATRWIGAAEVQAHRWGVPLAPFPGLT